MDPSRLQRIIEPTKLNITSIKLEIQLKNVNTCPHNTYNKWKTHNASESDHMWMNDSKTTFGQRRGL